MFQEGRIPKALDLVSLPHGPALAWIQPPPVEAGCDDRVGLEGRGYRREPGSADRIVGVAEGQPFSSGRPGPHVAGVGGAAALRRLEDAEVRKEIPESFGLSDGLVGRAVVHDDDFPLEVHALMRQRSQLMPNRPGFIEAWDNDADLHVRLPAMTACRVPRSAG